METYKDAKGIVRELSLTIGLARKAKTLFKIDFIDGEPSKLCHDLLIRKVLQIDLIWFLMQDKSKIEALEVEDDQEPPTEQESFETIHLDGEAFERARLALFAEIENFIQHVRPETLELIREAISLLRTEITESAKNAASLYQSKEVKEAFLKANADATSKALEAISKASSESAELSD